MASKSGPMGRERTDGAVFKGGYLSGNDAAYIEPKLIPDFELLPRDDSGGPEWDPYTAEFGDGGYTVGDKAHLSARGGSDDKLSSSDEQDEEYRTGGRNSLSNGKGAINPKPPASSKKLEKE